MAEVGEDLAQHIGKVSVKHNPFSYKKFVSKRPDGDDNVRKSSTKKSSASSNVPLPDFAEDSLRQPVQTKSDNPYSFKSFVKEKKSTSGGDIREKKRKKEVVAAVKPRSSHSNSSISSQSGESDSDLPFPSMEGVSRRSSNLPDLDLPMPIPSSSSSTTMEALPLPPYKSKSQKSAAAKSELESVINSQQTLSSEQSSMSDDDDDDDDDDGDDVDDDDDSGDDGHPNGLLPLPSQVDSDIVDALMAEKVQLSAELQETKQLLLQERKKCRHLEKAVEISKKKEKVEAQALADMVKKAEENLKLTTKRAVSAESKAAHLRKENMILQAKLAKQEQQQSGRLPPDHHYEGVLTAVREKASQGAKQIDQSADKAEELLKDLMLGVRSLRQLSDVLMSIDKIAEVKEPSSSSS